MKTATITTTAIFEKLDASMLFMLTRAVEDFPRYPMRCGHRVLFAMEDAATAWQFGCISFTDYDAIIHALGRSQLLPISMMDAVPY